MNVVVKESGKFEQVYITGGDAVCISEPVQPKEQVSI
jgi:hypothetical protein